MNMIASLTHKSDEWATPASLYQAFMKQGFKDPCPLGCKTNALETRYENERLFVNTPFSKLKEFALWIIEQAKQGCDIYLLMPTRTDTRYFKALFEYGFDEIIFIHKRLRYNDSKTAPFNSMVLHINKSRSMKCKLMTCEELIEFIAEIDRRKEK